WIRALGDLIMALIPLIEIDLIAALKRLLSRVGFVLLPSSILLIKYFPNLGRGYDVTGLAMNTGVTTNKNELRVITFATTLGIAWQSWGLRRDKKMPNRTRHLLAQGMVLYFGISVLFAANSATSGVCFLVGSAIMLITHRPLFRQRPAALHILIIALL